MSRRACAAMITVMSVLAFAVSSSPRLCGQTQRSKGSGLALPAAIVVLHRNDPRVLKSEHEVLVLVEPPGNAAEDDGLRAQNIQTDIELRLRQAGITVIDKDKFGTIDVAVLHVITNCLKNGGRYAVNVQFEFMVDVTPYRHPRTVVTDAITWNKSFLLVHPSDGDFADYVRSSIKDEADTFVNDYLKVNPKSTK